MCWRAVGSIVTFGFGLAVSLVANAQDFSLDGFYGCARATNGKAYCKQVGRGENYFPVSDEFLQRFMTAKAGSAPAPIPNRPGSMEAVAPPPSGSGNVTQQQQQQNITNTTVNNTVIVQNLQRDASEARGLIELYTKMIEEQKKQSVQSGDRGAAAVAAVDVLNQRIELLRKQFAQNTTELGRYQTSIRPNDPDRKISARKASELFPKVPWYVPGSTDVGEFWIEPVVSDQGALEFNVKFIDPSAEGDKKIKSTFVFSKDDLVSIQKALQKLVGWAKVAHEKKVRNFTRSVDCSPAQNCVPEDQRKPGITSTEIIFQVSDEGATSGRIQRNKGRFKEGYNISIDSAVWLQAYLNHIIIEGSDEFDAGSRSKADVEKLFE